MCNNGAIELNAGVRLFGRALTTTGALSTNAITVTMPPGCCNTNVTANTQLTGYTGAGEALCINALQTITVAGGGTPYIVYSDGSVTLIAGQNIRFLDGTRVFSGSYLH